MEMIWNETVLKHPLRWQKITAVEVRIWLHDCGVWRTFLHCVAWIEKTTTTTTTGKSQKKIPIDCVLCGAKQFYPVHAIIQAANHEAAMQCINLCNNFMFTSSVETWTKCDLGDCLESLPRMLRRKATNNPSSSAAGHALSTRLVRAERPDCVKLTGR